MGDYENNPCFVLQVYGNYEAYLVGGSVRDVLLAREPKDYDIATNATPEQVTELFEGRGFRVVPTGVEHGTVTVVGTSLGDVEITTYRKDGKYSDGRRPDEVRYAETIEEDLSRRDFTMNAIAMDYYLHRLKDPHNGHNDIDRKLIRAVGNPKQRFLEDGLRPIRAARFAAQLGFEIEAGTKEAMRSREVHDVVMKVAKERIRDELLKALGGRYPQLFFTELRVTGLLKRVLPFMTEIYGVRQNPKYHHLNVYDHTLEVVECLPEKPILRMAGLLHDIGKGRTLTYDEETGEPHFYKHEHVGADMVEPIMRRLAFSTEEIRFVKALVKNHMVKYDSKWTDAGVRRLIRRVGEEYVFDLIQLRTADVLAHSRRVVGEHLDSVTALRDHVARVLEDKTHDVNLAINGDDIMALGVPAGPEVGRIKDALTEMVVEDPDLNARYILLNQAKKLMEGEE